MTASSSSWVAPGTLIVSGIACLNRELRGVRTLMAKHRIYTTSFASVYPHYVAKATKKGRTKAEVDEIISWLTGYRQKDLEAQLKKTNGFRDILCAGSQDQSCTSFN